MKKRKFPYQSAVRQQALTAGLPLITTLAVSIGAMPGAHAQVAPSSRGSQTAAPTTMPQTAPQLAPAFTLPDVEGKTHSLSDYHGQPVTLYFYCGCSWCHRCAQAWSGIQHSGTLAQIAAKQPSASPSKTAVGTGHAPLTLIVFTGDAEEARNFARETQLDPRQTLCLLDPDEKVSPLYQATPCPRVFILDPQGRIRYTNNEEGKESYKIPAPLIVARAVDALRAVSTGTASSGATPKTMSRDKVAKARPGGKAAFRNGTAAKK